VLSRFRSVVAVALVRAVAGSYSSRPQRVNT
jgi:hypothetical protein